MRNQTASQTIGPFFAFAMTPEGYGRIGIASNVLVRNDSRGDRIRIHGRVVDGNGESVKDALLEMWQADEEGCYHHPAEGRKHGSGFTGFGRRGTDDNGMYSFLTIKPGQVPGTGTSLQAPHINLIVFARGMLSHAYTRLYFSDEEAANASDPVLKSVEPSRRSTLIAMVDEMSEIPRYSFDIRLQGEEETVFFDV